ncbi:MAG: DNA-3-methyladenine glycosylase [Roseovarius sp.]
MSGRLIETPADVAAGAAHLAAICPRLAHAHALCAPLPLRRRADGFAALLGIIVSQQLSTSAAAAIEARMRAARLVTPAAILRADDDALRGVGLSRQKIRYLRALAAADVDFAALRALPDAALVARLTALPGVGAWTAEIYAMFCLGRADVFAPGDLALREAARLLYGLPERPRAAELRRMAEAWAPWRSVAARLLWAYYRIASKREGIR